MDKLTHYRSLSLLDVLHRGGGGCGDRGTTAGTNQRVFLLRMTSLIFRVLCTPFSTSGLAMREVSKNRSEGAVQDTLPRPT